MSANDAIKDMLYGHEHRWRVAEHELAQARSEVARLTAEVEAMRATADRLAVLLKGNHVGHGAFPRSGCGVCKPVDDALDALRAQKVGG